MSHRDRATTQCCISQMDDAHGTVPSQAATIVLSQRHRDAGTTHELRDRLQIAIDVERQLAESAALTAIELTVPNSSV
jgi:hypothetical protein